MLPPTATLLNWLMDVISRYQSVSNGKNDKLAHIGTTSLLKHILSVIKHSVLA
jgi:hypothetical protein